jgi:hypothetical protein
VILESIWLIGFEGSSCDCPLVQAPSLFDGLSFDGFPAFEYGRFFAGVDVSRSTIQARSRFVRWYRWRRCRPVSRRCPIALMEQAGFVDVCCFGPEDAARTYLGGRRDGLRMPRFSRLIKGCVG